MKITTITGHEYDIYVKVERYQTSGRLAIRLIDILDGVPVATLTTNQDRLPCAVDHCYIKDYSENEGLMDQMIKYGVISPVIGYVDGFPYVKFLTSTP